ncbi:MAG: hypothetical protein JOZ54_10835 [Acidobacteria bacterium]|nr:hypothetical protein [Acidobacteriota bacterium]
MRKLVVLILFAAALRAQNTNNDSSCDIGVAPAATLLLPYFEVETAERGITTIFSVTNVSAQPHVAHVTLWTDYDYPALSFHLYLTPYDVQPVNLYDVIVDGVIAADAGPIGSSCGELPRTVPPQLLGEARLALQIGTTATCTGSSQARRIGSIHGTLAAGYATIDVVKDCSAISPPSQIYFRDLLLFDNVLIGDYETIDPAKHAAGGTPLVHIRAVPEGGPAGASAVPTPLQTTFYSRYLGELAPGFDRRQPLPATFAARFVQGGGFETRFKIWREGSRGVLQGCAGYQGSGGFAPTRENVGNSFMRPTEIVRFDEHENSFVTQFFGEFPFPSTVFPAASARRSDSSDFPPFASPADDRAGWIYLNLDSQLGARGPELPSQNWVVTSLSVPDLFQVDMDAAWLGNGCTPPIRNTEVGTVGVIGPAGRNP